MLQNSGLKRNIIDKFYTKSEITELCKNYILQNIHIDKNNDLIIEPSAGNGSFINCIKNICDNFKFYDIEPEQPNIEKLNYFDLDFSKIKNHFSKIHIVGNPPFGRQSSLALQFIKYSALYSDTISFILPKSFKKDSFKNKIPLNFHCKFEVDLPKNAFLLNGKEYNVPCVFQIWIKQNFDRNIPEKIIPFKFSFVKKCEPHDISFRRVGINAGHIDINTIHKSEQSHYFIKFVNDVYNIDLINKLSEIEFKESSDTVGPKSISKQELVIKFNNIIKKFYNL